jgi:hypothetical protein
MVRAVAVFVLVVVLAGCTQPRTYQSVRWFGQIDSYPGRDCIEPVLRDLPGVTQVDWHGALTTHYDMRGYNLRRETYSWVSATGSSDISITIGQPYPSSTLFEMRYFRGERPEFTAFGNALIAKIAAACRIPDLAQRLRYEHMQETHMVPFWAY